MQDRRRACRNRVYYGGVLAFNARQSTFACVVRNVTSDGARIDLDGAALLPDEFDIEIARQGLSCRARLIWRSEDSVGLRFCTAENSDVIPLAMARQLRARDRANQQLKARLDQLLSGR